MDESERDGHDSKPKGHAGQEPPRSEPLAGHGAGDLKHNVRYVEDGENLVVLIPGEAQVAFEASESSIAFAEQERSVMRNVKRARRNPPIFARSMKQNRYLSIVSICRQKRSPTVCATRDGWRDEGHVSVYDLHDCHSWDYIKINLGD